MRGIPSNFDLFFEHSKDCDICSQHPQSVASFYYNPMCILGKAIADTFMKFDGSPSWSGWDYYLHDDTGFTQPITPGLDSLG